MNVRQFKLCQRLKQHPRRNRQPLPGAPFATRALGIDRDAFMQLLLAQLRNQDPMKPMEDKDSSASWRS